MKGKVKFGKKLLGTVMALSMTLTAMTGWAAMYTDYAKDGAAAGPVPGAMSVSAVADQKAQMMTAVYDATNGSLVEVALSNLAEAGQSVTTNLNLTTVDGYIVKNYIWNGVDTMVPLVEEPQTNNLLAEVSGDSTRVVLSWKELSKDEATASYAVVKNGVLLSETISKEKASFIERNLADGTYTYRVLAKNAAGAVISLSQEVSIVVADPDALPSATLDASSVANVKTEVAAAMSGDTSVVGNALFTWSSDVTNRADAPIVQLTSNGSKLDYVAGGIAFNNKTYYYEGDGTTWNIVTKHVDSGDGQGTMAFLTAQHVRLNNDSYQHRDAWMMFDFGNDFTAQKNIDITIRYLDNKTGSVKLTYLIDETGKTAEQILTMQGKGGWQEHTFELRSACFNVAGKGVWNGLGDIMFTPQNTDVPFFLNSIQAEVVNPKVASLNAGSTKQSWDGTGAGDNLYTWDSAVVNKADASIVQITKNNNKLDYIEGGVTANTGSKYYYMGDRNTWDIVTKLVDDVDGQGTKAFLTSKHVRALDGNTTYGDTAKELRDGQMIFDVGNVFDSNDKALDVTIKYRNNQAGTVQLRYLNGDGSTQGTKLITMTGDSEWKETTISIDDACFNAAGKGIWNGLGDIIFFPTDTDVPFFLNSIQISIPESNEGKEDILYPNGVSCEMTETGFTAQGANFRYLDATQTDWDTASHYLGTVKDTKGVSKCAVSTASYGYKGASGKNLTRPTALYFDVDDAYMLGEKDTYAIVEFEYLDHGERMMYIQYNGIENGVAKDNINKEIGRQTNTGEWKTAKVVLTNACFSNLWQVGAEHGASDFRIGTSIPEDEGMGSGAGTLQDQLVIANLTVKNISHKTVSHSDGVPSIYIAGDSIAADYPTNYAVADQTGWGETLRNQLKNGAEVRNYASAGKALKTFTSFDTITDGIYKNDYVFISFGHNDSDTSDAGYVTTEEYKASLISFIKEVQASQAIPVVLSSIPCQNGGDASIAPYRTAAAAAAKETNAVYVDLYQGLNEAMTGNADQYYVSDLVHLNEAGAELASEVIVNALKNDSGIRVLQDYLK